MINDDRGNRFVVGTNDNVDELVYLQLITFFFYRCKRSFTETPDEFQPK